MYRIDLQEKEDLTYLIRFMELRIAQYSADRGAYIEFLIICERVLISLQAAVKIKDEPDAQDLNVVKRTARPIVNNAGCPTHPFYRAQRRPRSGCPRCMEMYEATHEDAGMAKLILCADHPTYGARRRPRTDCPTCWAEFARLNGQDQAKIARRDFDRKYFQEG